MNKKELESLKELGVYEATKKLIEFCNKIGESHYIDYIITNDEVTEKIKYVLDCGGSWCGVACMIADIINNMDEPYYFVGGDGNFELLTQDYIIDIIDEIIENE